MVYDQVKLAGGTLRLANGGTGARVTVRLPLRAAPAQLFLLVEDDDMVRSQIRAMLTGQGACPTAPGWRWSTALRANPVRRSSSSRAGRSSGTG